jgi:nucleotide-binding universal stress UspA family protein
MAADVDSRSDPSTGSPIRRLLVATDFSDASAGALLLAARLARAFDAELLIAHVLPEREDPHAKATLGMSPGDLLERRAGEAGARLRRLESLLGRGHAHAAVRCGAAAVEIARLASDGAADLIVLGWQGGEGGPHGTCGEAIAERVRTRVRCPVLIALPASPETAPAGAASRGLLVATDPATRSEALVGLGRALASRLDCPIHLQAGGSAAQVVSMARALGDDAIVMGPRRGRLRAALHLSAA